MGANDASKGIDTLIDIFQKKNDQYRKIAQQDEIEIERIKLQKKELKRKMKDEPEKNDIL